jgi:hypothetical protein
VPLYSSVKRSVEEEEDECGALVEEYWQVKTDWNINFFQMFCECCLG